VKRTPSMERPGSARRRNCLFEDVHELEHRAISMSTQPSLSPGSVAPSVSSRAVIFGEVKRIPLRSARGDIYSACTLNLSAVDSSGD
jgi:hypothetical protein